MGLYFFANNLHFAINLLGGVVALMAGWLTFDTYAVSRSTKMLIRSIGFVLLSAWQIIGSVGTGNDVLLFCGFALLVVGLAGILGSFLVQEEIAMPAVLVIPSFTAYAAMLSGIEAVLLLGIAGAAFAQSRKEMNPTWRSFVAAFLLLAAAAAFAALTRGNLAGVPALVSYALQLAGWGALFLWVWQFLALRIRESLVIIFISAALFLSTVVTLAFSTILIGEITNETEANLLADAQVLSLDVHELGQESLAEAALLAADPRVAAAIAGNDFQTLTGVAETFMEQYDLGFITVTDAQGTVLVRAHALSKRGDSLAGERAFEEARSGSAFSTVESSPVEGLSIRSGAPITVKGKVVGTIIAGYPLDNALVDGVKRVTGLDMFVYDGSTSVAATAFAEDGVTRLTGIPLSDPATREVLSGEKSATASSDLRGQTFLASYLPLINGDGKVIGMLSSAKPEQDILDIVNATNRLTLFTVIVMMLALAVPVYLFARRLSEGS